MTETASIKVTKLDAAERQLGAGIRLWFHEGDPVSIHTLLHAAHEIIHRLYHLKGLGGLLYDSPLMKKELQGAFAKRLKEAPNFFKHAKRDQELTEEIEFRPQVNKPIMLMLCSALSEMGVSESRERKIFVRWMMVQEPELFLESALKFIPIDGRAQVRDMPKREFFDMFEALEVNGGDVVAALQHLR